MSGTITRGSVSCPKIDGPFVLLGGPKIRLLLPVPVPDLAVRRSSMASPNNDGTDCFAVSEIQARAPENG